MITGAQVRVGLSTSVNLVLKMNTPSRYAMSGQAKQLDYFRRGLLISSRETEHSVRSVNVSEDGVHCTPQR